MLKELQERYRSGANITGLLKDEGDTNSEEAIEIAYEMQAGTYIAAVKANPENYARYFEEIAGHLRQHVISGQTILDCGTGELTTLCGVADSLSVTINWVGLDISLSRLMLGRIYAAEKALRPEVVCAALGTLPLVDDAVDVTMTTHALEPNHGRELQMLKELIRITRERIVLFEPYYEIGLEPVRERMDRLGYVRNLDEHIAAAGGVVIQKTILSAPLNLLNPTCCWVIDVQKRPSTQSGRYRCVRTGAALEDRGTYLWSAEGLYGYPKVDGIPVLKRAAALPLANLPKI